MFGEGHAATRMPLPSNASKTVQRPSLPALPTHCKNDLCQVNANSYDLHEASLLKKSWREIAARIKAFHAPYTAAEWLTQGEEVLCIAMGC